LCHFVDGWRFGKGLTKRLGWSRPNRPLDPIGKPDGNSFLLLQDYPAKSESGFLEGGSVKLRGGCSLSFK